MSLLLSQHIFKQALCTIHARSSEKRVFDLIGRLHDEETKQPYFIRWGTAYARFTVQCQGAVTASPIDYEMIRHSIDEFHYTMLIIEAELFRLWRFDISSTRAYREI